MRENLLRSIYKVSLFFKKGLKERISVYLLIVGLSKVILLSRYCEIIRTVTLVGQSRNVCVCVVGGREPLRTWSSLGTTQYPD